MGKRINAGPVKRKPKTKKVKGNRRIHHEIKSIEKYYWNNRSLDKRTKIQFILVQLKEFSIENPQNSIIQHAIIKWNDKFGRI